MRRLTIFLAIFITLTGGLLFWLLDSSSGLQTLARLAGSASGGRLQITAADGRLAGPLSIGELRWQDKGMQVGVQAIRLDWSPRALFDGRLHIAELTLGELRIDVAASDEAAVVPTDLQLPLAVDIEKLEISALHYGEQQIASALSGRFASDGRQHRLTDFRGHSADVAVHGQASLDGAAPFPLAASFELQGQLDDRPLAVAAQANGPLERIGIDITARAGIEGSAQLQLTPFAPTPFADAQIQLRNIDPAAWQAGLPSALIDLDADVTTAGTGVSARFQLANRQPGPLDRQALPFTRFTGAVDWHDGQLALPTLHATLAGDGTLAGQGRWQGDSATGNLLLELTAQKLDAIRLHSQLRPTQLAGTINAGIARDRQQLAVDLKDRRFAIRGEASHANAAVDLQKLEISASDASLQASGKLQLDELKFTLDAKLQRFDPSRFAQVPAARINATIQASGQLQDKPQVDASFELNDSLFAKQPMSGQGQLKLAWPTIPAIAIRLALGDNHLDASGAFGKPGDRLLLVIDAPKLEPFGGEGGIAGRIELAGSLAQPQLVADLQAATLGIPGAFRLRGLKLAAQLAEAAEAPLHLDLALDHLESAAHIRLASKLKLSASGNRRQHRLQLDGLLAENERLHAVAEGGLDASGFTAGGWQGKLSEWQIVAPAPARNLRLLAPAPVRLSSTGWQIGPLQLAGDPLDWKATIDASSQDNRLSLNLRAEGSRIGRVSGQLSAAMAGPWQLAGNQAWQGRAEAAIADIGWLGELIGEGWHSAGQVDTQLQLTGTPDQPLLDGTLRGRQLSLRIADQGMALTDGELAADISNNLLSVRRLAFTSQRQPMPRPLRLALGTAAAPLEQPGKLEISGEMRVDRDQPAGLAALDIRLDRVGIWQRPDQWVSLSGQGKLNWQRDALGINGQLAIDAAFWQLADSGAPRLSDDVVIRRPGEAKTTPLRPKLELDVNADFGRHFLFEGAGLSTRLAGQIRLSASGRDLPRASGTIRTRDGRFEAYGQQLQIERGILTFQGLPDNPVLDVRAVRKGLAVEPGVQLSGTAQKPVIRLISDPDLPDAEKLSWLILGHGQESMGAGDASVLLSAAGGLLGNDAGNVVQQLKQTFGIDEFGVRQGTLDGSGSRQPSSRVAGSSIDTTAVTGNQILSIGKRLSSNATLSYEQSLGTAESIVKLSIALTREISLIGRAGSDNALDLFYTLTWGLPPRRERQRAVP